MSDTPTSNKSGISVLARAALWGIAYAIVGALTGIGCLIWWINYTEGYSDPSGLGTAFALVSAVGTTTTIFLICAPVAYLISQSGTGFISRWPNLVWMSSLVAFCFLYTAKQTTGQEARQAARPPFRYHVVFVNQRDEVMSGVYYTGYGTDYRGERYRTDIKSGYGSYSHKGFPADLRAYYEDGTWSDEDKSLPVWGGHTNDFVEFSASKAPRGFGCMRDTLGAGRLPPNNPVASRIKQKYLPSGTKLDTFGVVRGWQFRPDDLATDELRFAYRLPAGEVDSETRYYALDLPASEGKAAWYPKDFKIEPAKKNIVAPLVISVTCANGVQGTCAISVTAEDGVAPADTYMFRAPDAGWQERLDHPELGRNGMACGFIRVGGSDAIRYGAYGVVQRDRHEGDLYVWIRLNTTGGPGLLAPDELMAYLKMKREEVENSSEYQVAKIFEPALDDWLSRMREKNSDFYVFTGTDRNIFFPNWQ